MNSSVHGQCRVESLKSAALFRTDFLDSTHEGGNSFAAQLKENDTKDIVPYAPVRLYYGEADVDVFPQKTLIAAAAMKAAGVRVEIVDLGVGIDHPASADLGLRAVRSWFDALHAEVSSATERKDQ